MQPPLTPESQKRLPSRQSSKLLLTLAITVVLGSRPCGTHDHIFLSLNLGSPLHITLGQAAETPPPEKVPLLAYFPFMSVCLSAPTTASQDLGKHVPAAVNTRITIE